MKRICLIRHAYYPDDPRVRRYTRSLVNHGWEVSVICLRRPAQASRELADGVRVYRLPIQHERSGRTRYIFEYIAFMSLATLLVGSIHLTRRLLVVQVHSLPDFLVFAAAIPKLLGAKVVLDLHEPLPELYAAKFGVGPGSMGFRAAELAQLVSTRFAAATITVTHQLKESLIARGVAADKVTVVHVVADGEALLSALEPNQPIGSSGSFRLVSHGTVSRGRGLDTLIRAVGAIRNQIPEIALDILGEGEQLPELQRLVDQLVLNGCVCLRGYVPFGEMVNTIARADVGIVGLERNCYSDLVLTNKMFDYFALGVPVIAAHTRALEEYFGSAGLMMFESRDVHSLAQALLKVYYQASLRLTLRETSRSLYRRYSWHVEQQRYLGLVDRLVGCATGIQFSEET